MFRVLLSLVLVLLSAPQPQPWYAARYGPGKHRTAALNHGIKPAKYMTATLYRRDLGKWFRVCGQKTGKCLNVKAVDYVHPRDLPKHYRDRVLTELDPAANLIVCGSNKEPPKFCPIIQWKIKPPT